ncbi:MAG: prepilin-type N-terminal cleavage/methylation domain-containing protein [Candidatus Omnitrophica bacterium]|nr:prepilin-type N-terminal cleavage/methylation domain-containing protein [Candidatus Omnitrophota bacterium]
MNISLRPKKGFTLTEIIAAALIITIAAGGTFSAYILARYFGNKFLHKAEAARIAQAIADDLRYRNSYNDDILDVPGNNVGPLAINDTAAPWGVPDVDLDGAVGADYHIVDVSGYGMHGEVDGLTAGYTVANVWFGNDGIEYNTYDAGNAELPQPPLTRPAFKKITVKLDWQERQAPL